mgnify:CR=1 FL=1
MALLRHRHTAGDAFFLTIGSVVILAGALYRFSAYLIAFRPGPEYSYFPTQSSELIDVFEEIASQLSNLRLAL